MSDGIKRGYSVTVRLSPDERAALEALAERFNLDKSATLRRALQVTSHELTKPLPAKGLFAPVPETDLAFEIHICDSHSCWDLQGG
ncbi:HPr family phosphocarrier protein [Phototrophicus methaneseepsis]|uniref:HPr family phosphocarrier protein n=1 Tax=Phototrophicus methaneseepsis TaxID=2710758 RepID=A0A7S8EAY6_9CHLR|nr:CopG family transcriptional regulator [Phototrophicus methaneseepsis]QPC83616.1 HPr family phosphocarrier protein [Phototrophicus methaneseepsis]